MKVLLWYLLIVNVLTFIMFNLDKWFATTGGWRISENTLVIASLAGGGIGGYMGMKFAHHKTKKPVFSVGLPVIGVVQLVLFLWISI